MKTAVFYDLENISLPSKNGELDQAIKVLRQKIEASELVKDIVLQKAYISKTYPNLTQLEPVLKNHQIELVAVEAVSNAGRKKPNLVDFKMSVDVIATIATRRSITTVAVASGDNDFGFLCQQIKDMGRKLLVISRYAAMGEAMLKLCDDWVNLSEDSLPPNFIRRAIAKRISTDYSQTGFFQALGDFFHLLENDVLIRRYLSSVGISLHKFITLLHERISKFPDYNKLGFKNISSFMEVLLGDTNFECQGDILKYNSNKQPLSKNRLIDNVLCLPPGYTREKLFKYYDILTEIDQIEELLAYTNFMKHTGMLKYNSLCNKRTFRATIRKHTQGMMEKAGIVLDEAALTVIDKKL